jgi:hypothetical protein
LTTRPRARGIAVYLSSTRIGIAGRCAGRASVDDERRDEAQEQDDAVPTPKDLVLHGIHALAVPLAQRAPG